jgi:hypothetical protein
MTTVTPSKKRKNITMTGVLYVFKCRGVTSLKVHDGEMLSLTGKKWCTQITEDGLQLTLTVTDDNEKTQVRAHRLDVENEIAHRTAEATELKKQRQTMLERMDEVPTQRLPTCHSLHMYHIPTCTLFAVHTRTRVYTLITCTCARVYMFTEWRRRSW